MLVAVGKRLVAMLSIADPLKPEAAAVVSMLRAAKVSCCMLTGDNKRTANAVAAMLQVDAVFAEVLPAEKAQVCVLFSLSTLAHHEWATTPSLLGRA